MVNEVSIKCAPSDDHSSEVCSEQCMPGENDPVLGVGAEDTQSLDYLRFCFFECKPSAGTTSPVDTQCIALEAAELHRTLDSRGMPVDLAVALSDDIPARSDGPLPDRQGPALLTASRSAGGVRLKPLLAASAAAPAPAPATAPLGSPAPAPGPALTPEEQEIQDAMAEVMKGKTQAVDMRKETRAAADALRLREASKAHGLASDPFIAIRDVEGSVEGSRAAAARAIQVTHKAMEALKKARDENWRAATGSVDKEVQRLREEDHWEVEEALERRRTWRMRAQEATAKWTKPYVDVVVQAQQSAQQWYVKACQTVDEANALGNKAKALVAEAGKLRTEGREWEATSKEGYAKTALSEAKSLWPRAKQMYGTAQAAARSANRYYALANQVAAQVPAHVSLKRGWLP